MPEELPRRFRKSSPAIASYDYLDYVSGAGYRNFYATMAETASGMVYFLSTTAMDSTYKSTELRRIQASGAGNSTEKNFDVTFNTNAIMQGTAYINFTLRLVSANGAGTVSFTLYKVVNSVETQIATAITPTNSCAGSDIIGRMNIPLTIPTTIFSPNDILRLEVIVSCSAGNSLLVAVDPTSLQTYTETTTSATIPTSLLVRLPFLTDI